MHFTHGGGEKSKKPSQPIECVGGKHCKIRRGVHLIQLHSRSHVCVESIVIISSKRYSIQHVYSSYVPGSGLPERLQVECSGHMPITKPLDVSHLPTRQRSL